MNLVVSLPLKYVVDDDDVFIFVGFFCMDLYVFICFSCSQGI